MNFQGKRIDVGVGCGSAPSNVTCQVIVSILDVTEFRATRSAWRESEAHFRRVFDSSPIPLIQQILAQTIPRFLAGSGSSIFRDLSSGVPEALTEAISRYQILAANPATLEVYGVRSVPEYIDFIPSSSWRTP